MGSQKFRQCYLEKGSLVYVTHLPSSIVEKGKIISFKDETCSCNLDKGWTITRYSPEISLDEIIIENQNYKPLNEIC